jgi:glutathione synthase/RimK-type ligase-like ATP-grasp enzyme
VNVALCTRNRANPVVRLLDSTLSARGHAVRVLSDPRELLDVDLGRVDVGLWRPDSRNEQVAAFARQVPEILEGAGVPLLNSLASADRAANKFVSYVLFRAAGIPTPDTWLAPMDWDAEVPIPEGPKIVKPLASKQGRDVANAATLNEAVALAQHTSQRTGQPCILQTPIRWTRQLRVVVARDACIRVYDQQPGCVESERLVARFDRERPQEVLDPPPDVLQLARRMVSAVGGDLMRADVLVDGENRLWALEVNSSFGFPHDDTRVLHAFESELHRVARNGGAWDVRSAAGRG